MFFQAIETGRPELAVGGEPVVERLLGYITVKIGKGPGPATSGVRAGSVWSQRPLWEAHPFYVVAFAKSFFIAKSSYTYTMNYLHRE
jgi:hypothetical protein